MISHLIICHKQTLEFSSCIEPIPEIEGKCPGDECNQTLFNNGILREAKLSSYQSSLKPGGVA